MNLSAEEGKLDASSIALSVLNRRKQALLVEKFAEHFNEEPYSLELVSRFLNAGYSFEDTFRAIASQEDLEEYFEEQYNSIQCEYEEFVDTYDEEEDVDDCYGSDDDYDETIEDQEEDEYAR